MSPRPDYDAAHEQDTCHVCGHPESMHRSDERHACAVTWCRCSLTQDAVVLAPLDEVTG